MKITKKVSGCVLVFGGLLFLIGLLALFGGIFGGDPNIFLVGAAIVAIFVLVPTYFLWLPVVIFILSWVFDD